MRKIKLQSTISATDDQAVLDRLRFVYVETAVACCRP